MQRDKLIEYCAINVAAHPHPSGVYSTILNQAALARVQYWGDHFATISTPVEREPGFLQGRLVAWTEINQDEPAVDKQKLEEVDLADLDLQIPDNLGFNGRIFLYTFRERDHTMFVETRNEFGKTLSARRVSKIIESLLSPEVLGPDAPLVEVTLIPDEDTLKRIFGLEKLKRLQIHLVRPNADDLDVEEVLAELDAQNAKSLDKVLTAVSGSEGLIPDQRTTTEAHVAEFNGYVEATGNEADGGLVYLSTKEHPRVFQRIIADVGSSIAASLQLAKEAVVRSQSG